MLRRIRAGLKQKLKEKGVLIDVATPKRTVFVAGTGRSGTTWLVDLINHAKEYRIIFEPFHPYKVDLVSHFNHRLYLRPDNEEKEFVEPIKAILSGRIRNAWTDRRDYRVFATKRLIKDIRANHLLLWIKTHFSEIPIVLLLRHPCAVASSKLKLQWETHLDVFLSQSDLMKDFLHPFQKHIERATTPFEKHIFMWCIENYVPLKQFRPGDVHVVLYEHLCTGKNEEIGRLFSFLGKRHQAIHPEAIQRPSRLSRQESAIHTGESLVDSWRQHITPEQVQSAVEILKLFGLDAIYAYDSMPLIKGEHCLNL